MANDTTPEVAIKVSTVDPLPLDGDWRHLFFTYDGSGKASGVKIYVDGAPVATRVVSDTLDRQTIRTQAPMQLGWRYPDANPAQRDALPGYSRSMARALTAEEAKRLPFEDYVAEMAAKPASQWNDDQWHAVSEFYLNSVDKSYRAIEDQIAAVGCAARQALRGRRPDAGGVGEAIDRLCQCADARRLHGAHRTSGGEHAALPARRCLQASRTTGWRWPNGR